MYGSCQQSDGMTPRYASAAELMREWMAAKSPSRHGRRLSMARACRHAHRGSWTKLQSVVRGEPVRRDAVVPPEAAREMALVAEAGGSRDIGGRLAGAQQRARQRQTTLH